MAWEDAQGPSIAWQVLGSLGVPGVTRGLLYQHSVKTAGIKDFFKSLEIISLIICCTCYQLALSKNNVLVTHEIPDSWSYLYYQLLWVSVWKTWINFVEDKWLLKLHKHYNQFTLHFLDGHLLCCCTLLHVESGWRSLKSIYILAACNL